MLDRNTAPATQKVTELKIPNPSVHTLDNSIPVYETHMGTQDIVKLEILFHAGRPLEEKRLAARATAALLKEGTTKMSSAEIAEKIDFYGGTLNIPVNLDTSNVILYSLTKHFEKLLPIVSDMVTNPIFPEKELNAFCERNIQNLAVDLTRGDVVAYRKITEFIFSENHPYGYNSSEKSYRNLTREDLKKHFQKNYHSGNCRIFISGKTTGRHIDLLNTYLGKVIPKGEKEEVVFAQYLSIPKKVKIPHVESMQTAIRIGCKLFNRTHPDFNGLYILNTILGGYFGSRLMANIREDKGYTYNIFSSLDAMIHDGYFYIGTEVGNEFTKKTLVEIYREMDLLKEELVGEEELNMVRNYLLGNMLTMLDGPFNVADVVKTYVAENLPVSNFDTLTQTIKSITAETLRDLARKYFKSENMWEVIV
jgi:predicted Zn-dependent peptidase